MIELLKTAAAFAELANRELAEKTARIAELEANTKVAADLAAAAAKAAEALDRVCYFDTAAEKDAFTKSAGIDASVLADAILVLTKSASRGIGRVSEHGAQNAVQDPIMRRVFGTSLS